MFDRAKARLIEDSNKMAGDLFISSMSEYDMMGRANETIADTIQTLKAFYHQESNLMVPQEISSLSFNELTKLKGTLEE